MLLDINMTVNGLPVMSQVIMHRGDKEAESINLRKIDSQKVIPYKILKEM